MKCPQCDWQSTDYITPGEHGVLELYVEGYNNVQIGEFLSVSPRTVEVYLYHIRQKTGAVSRRELMRFAATHGHMRPEWKQLLAGG